VPLSNITLIRRVIDVDDDTTITLTEDTTHITITQADVAIRMSIAAWNALVPVPASRIV